MKFKLIDRITDLVPGERISAVKALSQAEEYLADHFPRFPVMPGVLMVEAMTQAAAWLVRATEDYAHSMVLLANARNVTYKSFVSPGQLLELTVEAKQGNGGDSRAHPRGGAARALCDCSACNPHRCHTLRSFVARKEAIGSEQGPSQNRPALPTNSPVLEVAP